MSRKWTDLFGVDPDYGLSESDENERLLRQARDLACAYEAQLAKVHAICAEWHKCILEPNRRPGWSGGAILHDIEKALQVRDE